MGGADRRAFMSWTNLPNRRAFRDVPTLASKSLRRVAKTMADEEDGDGDGDGDESREEARRILVE